MTSTAVRALTMELRNLQLEPVEGFRVKLLGDGDLFEWEVALFGPPDTLYQGGYFKAVMRFPSTYPYAPPTFRFLTRMFHPNIYPSGDLCISILHPPVDDPQSGELASERWNPTQNVRTILLSVISLLNEPNTSSPANVDASVMYRRWKDNRDEEYERIIKLQVKTTEQEASRDGVTVPRTLEEYCIQSKPPKDPDAAGPSGLHDMMDDFFDDDDIDDDDEGEESDLSEFSQED